MALCTSTPPNGNIDGMMNQLVMARVPTDRILDRSAYEFFAGRNADGSGRWAADIASREHVFPPGWVNVNIIPMHGTPVLSIMPRSMFI